MARVEFTLKVVTFGDKKPFVNNYLFIDGDEAAHHLRTVIKNEVNKAKDGIVFNAVDDEISEIIGVVVSILLACWIVPCTYFLQNLKKSA